MQDSRRADLWEERALAILIGPVCTAEAITAAMAAGQTLGDYVSWMVSRTDTNTIPEQVHIPGNEMPWHGMKFVNGNHGADIMLPKWLHDLFVANTAWDCVENGRVVLVAHHDLPKLNSALTINVCEGRQTLSSFNISGSIYTKLVVLAEDQGRDDLGEVFADLVREKWALTGKPARALKGEPELVAETGGLVFGKSCGEDAVIAALSDLSNDLSVALQRDEMSAVNCSLYSMHEVLRFHPAFVKHAEAIRMYIEGPRLLAALLVYLEKNDTAPTRETAPDASAEGKVAA